LIEEQTLFLAVTRLCDADTQAAMVQALRQRRCSSCSHWRSGRASCFSSGAQ